jgi:hypothetical protein
MFKLFVTIIFSSMFFLTWAQSHTIQSANNWLFGDMLNGYCDSVFTSSYLIDDSESQGLHSQVFVNYGWTSLANKSNNQIVWSLAPDWYKFVNPKLPLPDTIIVDLKYLASVNASAVTFTIAVKNDSEVYTAQPIALQLQPGYLTLMFNMIPIKQRISFFKEIHFRWNILTTDSNYVGCTYAVDNLRGIDDSLGFHLYDGFGDSLLTAIHEASPTLLNDYTLFQNYPNPFNPTTTIKYTLPGTTSVQLILYNLLGQRIDLIYSGVQNSGVHSLKLNSELLDIPSGCYIYSFFANGQLISSKKLMFMK